VPSPVLQVSKGTVTGNASPLFAISQSSSGSCYTDIATAEVWDADEEILTPAKTLKDASNQIDFEAALLTPAMRPAAAPLRVSSRRLLFCDFLLIVKKSNADRSECFNV
jgi:hypothetical protein